MDWLQSASLKRIALYFEHIDNLVIESKFGLFLIFVSEHLHKGDQRLNSSDRHSVIHRCPASTRCLMTFQLNQAMLICLSHEFFRHLLVIPQDPKRYVCPTPIAMVDLILIKTLGAIHVLIQHLTALTCQLLVQG